MRRFQVVSAVVMVLGMLVAVGITSPPASAEEITLTDPFCTRNGLATAIDGAEDNDVIVLDCANPSINDFAANGNITVNKAITIDGGDLVDQMTLNGNGVTNFFVVLSEGHLKLEHLRLENGSADEGGAISVGADGELTTTGVVFGGDVNAGHQGNSANFNGGALFIDEGGMATLNGGRFFYNSAKGAGGAILASSDSTVIIDDVLFVRNTTNHPSDGRRDGGGGAIYAGGATVTITDSSMDDNSSAEWHGGGIYLGGSSTLNVTNTGFGNDANQEGGSLFCAGSTLDLTSTVFGGGTAGSDGGALALHNCDATIDQSLFSDNHAGGDGGAIYSDAGSSVDISRSTFLRNGTSLKGGAIATFNSSLHVNATTFALNDALTNGGDIRSSLATDAEESVAISWSTFVQKDAGKPSISYTGGLTLTGVILGGPGAHCEINGSGDLIDSYTLSNSDSCGLTGEGSDVHADLGLPASYVVDQDRFASQFYFPLEADSPAINTGPADCDTTLQADPDTDQLGNLRPINMACDIGAFEAANIAPDITDVQLTPNQAIDEGESVLISVDIADTDTPGTSITTEIDCDINDPESAPPTESTCTYPDNGTFTGLVTANDGYAQDTQTFTVDVNNVEPDMQPIAITTPAGVNAPFNFQMTATDVPADTLTFTYACGDASDEQTIPAISSSPGTFSATGSCTYSSVGSYKIVAQAKDDDLGVSIKVYATVEASILANLCANEWTGQLRMIDDGEGCGRSETLIQLPADAPLELCVNNWNGSASLGGDCGRSEYQLSVDGDGTIDVCVNDWNGTIRVSDQCSRSEHDDVL